MDQLIRRFFLVDKYPRGAGGAVRNPTQRSLLYSPLSCYFYDCADNFFLVGTASSPVDRARGCERSADAVSLARG